MVDAMRQILREGIATGRTYDCGTGWCLRAAMCGRGKSFGPSFWLVWALIGGVLPGMAADRIGDIEFFGYKGIDVAKVRAALPIHTGDNFSRNLSENLRDRVREAIAKAIGKPPTEVA